MNSKEQIFLKELGFMKNTKTIFLLILLSSNCCLYTSEYKPEIVISEASGSGISSIDAVMPTSQEEGGFISDFELDEEAKKPDTGSIKEEVDYAFLSKKLARVSLKPKKMVSQEDMVKNYLVSVRAAAGKKPEKPEVFEVSEPKPKMPHRTIEHVGPKAKGSLTTLGVHRRNMERSYPGLFWDKRK